MSFINVTVWPLQLLDQRISHLLAFLTTNTAAPLVLQIFVDLATVNPEPFQSHITILKKTAEQTPTTLSLVAKVIGCIGKINEVRSILCSLLLAFEYIIAVIKIEQRAVGDWVRYVHCHKCRSILVYEVGGWYEGGAMPKQSQEGIVYFILDLIRFTGRENAVGYTVPTIVCHCWNWTINPVNYQTRKSYGTL